VPQGFPTMVLQQRIVHLLVVLELQKDCSINKRNYVDLSKKHINLDYEKIKKIF